jgi:hypothetical protein
MVGKRHPPSEAQSGRERANERGNADNHIVTRAAGASLGPTRPPVEALSVAQTAVTECRPIAHSNFRRPPYAPLFEVPMVLQGPGGSGGYSARHAGGPFTS